MIVPVRCTIELSIVVPTESNETALTLAAEHIQKHYESGSTPVIQGKYIKGSALFIEGEIRDSGGCEFIATPPSEFTEDELEPLFNETNLEFPEMDINYER
jgi:hypothetical protein